MDLFALNTWAFVALCFLVQRTKLTVPMQRDLIRKVTCISHHRFTNSFVSVDSCFFSRFVFQLIRFYSCSWFILFCLCVGVMYVSMFQVTSFHLQLIYVFRSLYRHFGQPNTCSFGMFLIYL